MRKKSMKNVEKFPLFGKPIVRTPFSEGIELLHFADTVFGSFLLHDHNYIELMLVMDGEIQVAAEGVLYQVPRKAMVIIPPGCIHRTVVADGTKRYERMVFHIFPQYLEALLKKSDAPFGADLFTEQVRILDYSPENFWLFRNFFERAFYCNHQDAEYQKLIVPCLAVELFVELRRVLQVQSPARLPATNNFVTAAVEYINEHFTDPGLTVDEVLESVYISKGYLSRLFKAYTGSSIYQYIIFKRTALAKEYLQRGVAVLDTCIACGFSDYTSFLKSFKKIFKVTPSQYRKNIQMEAEGGTEGFAHF